jgi:hypothetical protein
VDGHDAASASAAVVLGRAIIPPMAGKRCRRVLFAILMYVALDLSLPTMPGAFVFEPADSAEGTPIRARAEAETVALPAQAREPAFVLFQPPLEAKERLAPVNSAERHGRLVVSWRSQAPYDSAPPSEDPH